MLDKPGAKDEKRDNGNIQSNLEPLQPNEFFFYHD